MTDDIHPLAALAQARTQGRPHGITSVCSAHPLVIEAALRQAQADGTPALIEATCNQVNQEGGYTGMTPADFEKLDNDTIEEDIAIKAAGKQDQISIGSIDGSCTGVENVKNGVIGATVMQFPTKMAEQGVEAIVAFAKDGTKPKAGFNDTGSVLITDQPVDGLDSEDTAWGAENCWG